VVAEPEEADCLTVSAASPDGRPTASTGTIHSTMACLNAGQVSLTSWPAIRRGTDLFLALEDRYAEEAMRRLYRPQGDDPPIEAGESGAASVAALIALAEDPRFQPAKAFLGLGPKTTVVAVCTEGAVDPEAFARIVGK
jgi:diaminopropionate ammonia-lyase